MGPLQPLKLPSKKKKKKLQCLKVFVMLYKRTSSMSTMVAPLPQQFILHENVDGSPPLAILFLKRKNL
jgi:hypothetical protein